MAILNGLRLAADYKVPLRIFWPRMGEPGDPIGDARSLFSDDFITSHFIDVEQVLPLRKMAEEISAVANMQSGEFLSRRLEEGAVYLMDSLGESQFCLSWEDRDAVRLRLANSIREEDFSHSLGPWMKHLREKLTEGSGGSTAYHVRHGDLTQFLRTRNRAWPTKFVPTEAYLAHMDYHRDQLGVRNVIVFGDNMRSLEDIRHKQPDCILFRDLVDLGKLRPIQLDFLELYAMSLCSRIIAPASSGFSRVAAIIGGSDIFDVMEDLPVQRLDQAMERLCARLEAGLSGFLTDGEIGQCMVHADAYLGRTGQEERSGSIMLRLIQDGVNISFLYPMAMARLIATGKDREAFEVSLVSLNRCIEERTDLCAVFARRSSVALRLGEPAVAARAACISLWAGGSGQKILEDAIGQLVTTDNMTAANFPPFDPDLQHLLDGKSRPNLAEQGTVDRQAVRFEKVVLSMACDWTNFLHGQAGRQLTPRTLNRLLDRAQIALGRLIKAEDRARLTSFQSRLLVLLCRQAEAVELGLAATATLPDDALASYRLATAFAASGDLTAALDAAERARSLNPEAATYVAYVAQLNVKLRKKAEAEEAFLAACELDPGLPSIGHEAAKFFKQLKKWDKAEACIDVALRNIPRDPTLLSLKGDILRGAGRHEEALKIFRELQDEGEDLRSYGAQIGGLLHESGHATAAIDHIATALRTDPGSGTLRVALARLQRQTKDFSGALETLDPAAVKFRDQAVIVMERGLVFEELGQLDKAISSAETAADLAQGSAWYMRNLDRVRNLAQGHEQTSLPPPDGVV